MKLNLFKILSMLFASLLIFAKPAYSSLLVNGSFESPTVGPTGIATISMGSSPAGFGWVVDAGNVEVFGELYPPLPGPSFNGQQHLDLNGVLVGTLSQTFSTIAGTDYNFSFVYASNYVHHDINSPALATVQIVDTDTGTDNVSPFSISHGTSSATDLDWTFLELIFTATGSSSSIVFTSDSINTPLGGILLDDVAVVVPLPSAGLLFLTGLLALATRSCRMRVCFAQH